MNDGKLGRDNCYICGWSLDPLTSTCPKCGYSQLPRDKAEKPGSLKTSQKHLRADLKSKLEQAKRGYRSNLKKK